MKDLKQDLEVLFSAKAILEERRGEDNDNYNDAQYDLDRAIVLTAQEYCKSGASAELKAACEVYEKTKPLFEVSSSICRWLYTSEVRKNAGTEKTRDFLDNLCALAEECENTAFDAVIKAAENESDN